MCGIAGLLKPPGQTVRPEELAAMARALSHRGPDDEGFYSDGNLGFAHRRLAILDLSPAGRQPMSNEDGSVWVAYNGQLYGFRPLRERLQASGHRFRSHTDTEVLVHLYEEKGDALVEEIDGMFAFALWDSRRRRLLLARDRLGIKPLFYARRGEDVCFASELSALTVLPGVTLDLDLNAVAGFLYQSSVPGPATILSDVVQLEPGHVAVFDSDGRANVRRYWTVPEVGLEPVQPARAADQLLDRLTAAARSHLVADVPVGAFLSGGLDSAAVALAVARAGGPPLRTFSVRFPEEPALDEGAAAAASARSLGTDHHELVMEPPGPDALLDFVRRCDQPFAVSSSLPLLQLARIARNEVKVVLTGDGADEVLAGYPWRHAAENRPLTDPEAWLRGLALTMVRVLRGADAGPPAVGTQLPARIGRFLAGGQDRYAELVYAFTPEELIELVADALRAPVRHAWERSPIRRAYALGRGDEVNRRLRTDLRTTLVDEMLTKVDRMTMAVGLEARVPFLDRELVEWAFRLPGALKARGGTGKRVLRAALARALPETASRRKHGLSAPQGAWLRGPLRELLLDALAPDAVRRRGLFRAVAVERLIAAHLRGRADHSRRVFTLLVLELWLRSRGL